MVKCYYKIYELSFRYYIKSEQGLCFMENIEELKHKMRNERPVQWEQLPDISLYMDQIVSYMSRQLIDFGSGEKLTSAMVNNYIKDGLMPRADGKRYSREHIAFLTAICMLKQVLPVKDTKVLMDIAMGHDKIKNLYDGICRDIDVNMAAISECLPSDDMSREEIADIILGLSVSAYCQQLACKNLIAMLKEDSD